jgi:hypothetical protein
MEETIRISTTEQLLQGDVLRLDDSKSQFDFNLAMIINADCDMQNKKHDGMIAILPIYTFQQYLEKFWLPVFFTKQKNEAIGILQNIFAIEDKHIEDLLSWMAQDSISVKKAGAASIFENYNPTPKQLTRADEALAKLLKIFEGISDGRLSAVSKFAPTGKVEKYCQDQVKEAKKQMGEDHFFITEIQNDQSVGYVIRMRRIYTIPVEACFKSEAAMLSRSNKNVTAYRICRLSPHYKFKASQLFAFQYSRIGLSDDVASLSELAIADMAYHFQNQNHHA